MNKTKTIEVGASIFEENDRIAQENRLLLKKNAVFSVNIMGSPGSGKTSVLERTLECEHKGCCPAVIEGDIQGSIDAQRLERFGIPVVQINTGGACHLDANMVAKGLEHLPLNDIDVLFIENVGNLVCPAEFDIGTDLNVIVTSVTEGEEKPLKYPLMFRISRICILNKTDLSAHSGFDLAAFTRNLKAIAPDTELMPLSAKTGEGFKRWTDHLLSSCLSSITRLPEIPYVEMKGRVVIVGLGDRMKGDDAAGCVAADILQKEIRRRDIRIINAENAMENYLGTIEKFKPDTVIIIDAADFGGKPGQTRILEPEQLRETTTSTHTFSLPLIIKHIRSETGAECTIIGIQPKTTELSEGLSPEVQSSVSMLTKALFP